MWIVRFQFCDGECWDFFEFYLCVPASPVVPVVTVPLSIVNVVLEVVFTESDCECVEPQTPLYPKNAKRV